jgi:hypothetical protein
MLLNAPRLLVGSTNASSVPVQCYNAASTAFRVAPIINLALDLESAEPGLLPALAWKQQTWRLFHATQRNATQRNDLCHLLHQTGGTPLLQGSLA